MLKILNKRISNKSSLYLALFISFLFTYPIYSSGVYYIDDLERSQNGISGWSSLGRPLADLIYFIFTLGHNGSVDISPMPQMISVAVMGISIHIFSKRTFDKVTFSNVIRTSLIFINPMFLHNLAYRYDSLSMVLSISICMYAATIDIKHRITGIACKAILIISSLCLYQVSAVSFVMLIIIIETIKVIKNNEIDIIDIIYNILSVAISYLAYFILINSLYKTNRSETIFSNDNWKELLLLNYKKFEALYSASYDRLSMIILLTSASITLTLCLIKIIKEFNFRSAKNKFLSIFVLFTPFIMLAASCATVIILSESIILPRIATSFGILIFFVVSIMQIFSKKLASSISCYLCIAAIIASFALGATMKAQYEKDLTIATQIKGFIENNKILSASKSTFIGISDQSTVGMVNSKIFPIIALINSPMYDYTGSLMLKRLGMKDVNFSFDRKKWLPTSLSVCQTSSAYIYNPSFSIYNASGQNYVFLGTSSLKCKPSLDKVAN